MYSRSRPTSVEFVRRNPSRSPEYVRRNRSKSKTRNPSRRPNSPEYRQRVRARSPARNYMRDQKTFETPQDKRARRKSRSETPEIKIKTCNQEFNEKLALQALGKWSPELERRWAQAALEESMVFEKLHFKIQRYRDNPNEHPQYHAEWQQFWERTYIQLEAAGEEDPLTYNYKAVWKPFWYARLTDFLQKEVDEEILAIKKKYEVDFQTLSNLRGIEKIKTENVKPAPPYTWTNPLISMSNTMTATPLTSSQERMLPITTETHDSFDQIVTDSRQIRQDGNINCTEIQAETSKKVTVQVFKSQWESLTQQKILTKPQDDCVTDGSAVEPNRMVQKRKMPESFKESSNSKRHQSASRQPLEVVDVFNLPVPYDFDGYELTQVLRSMCNLSQYLGPLAPKILEYFKTAEELVLVKHCSSHILLEDINVVSAMFQSKEILMNLICSRNLSLERLRDVNRTVYAMNMILDSPQCQNIRTQLPILLADLEISDPPVQVNNEETIDAGTERAAAVFDESNEIAVRLRHISFEKKDQAATLITNFLVKKGKRSSSISDSQLKTFVKTLLASFFEQSDDVQALNHDNGSRTATAHGEPNTTGRLSPFSRRVYSGNPSAQL